MGDDWTELYRPKSLKDVVGNPKAVKELREWAQSWEKGRPHDKAVVLKGPPGIGKTSTALALARDMGWGVVEMNASDHRNADSIQKIAIRGAVGETFSDTGEFLSTKEGRHKLIILDEADNVFGREDHGGVPAIAELIQTTKQPVILIVNDLYALSRRSSAIKSARAISFSKINASTMKALLRRIAEDQGVAISEKALEHIAENANGDMRAAVRDLQAVSLGAMTIEEDDAKVMDSRLSTKSMYDLMGEILHGSNGQKAKRTMMDIGETPDFVLKWLDENVPLEYKDHGDLERAFDRLSRADIFLGRVMRRQYYGFWGYATDNMALGVTLAKKRLYHAWVQYRFPFTIMRLASSKNARGVEGEVILKIGRECHASKAQTQTDILPYFQTLYQVNKEFRLNMSVRLNVHQEEAAYLLDQKVDSASVKHLMQELAVIQNGPNVNAKAEDEARPKSAEKKKKGRKKSEPLLEAAEKEPEPKPEPVIVPKEEPKKEPEPERSEPVPEEKTKQKSLFDFEG
jgi:replication factor C large subunit